LNEADISCITLFAQILTNTGRLFFLPTLKTAFTTRINKNLAFLNVWEKPHFNGFAHWGEDLDE
jgi:hypothetical protein